MRQRGWAQWLGVGLLVLLVWVAPASAEKISERPDATLPLAGDELVGVVQSGLDFKATAANVCSAGMGTANASAPTLTEGAGASLSTDLSGNVRQRPGTMDAGEDPTATGAYSQGVRVVEHRYLSSGTKTADFQVKATAGFVHSIYCIGNDGTAVAGTIKLFDNTAESGTELYSLTITATDYSHTPILFPIDVNASTGIYLGYTTTSDVACTVTYR